MYEMQMHLKSRMFNLGMLQTSVFDIFQHKVKSLPKSPRMLRVKRLIGSNPHRIRKLPCKKMESVVKNEQWTAVSLTHVEYTKGKSGL